MKPNEALDLIAALSSGVDEMSDADRCEMLEMLNIVAQHGNMKALNREIARAVMAHFNVLPASPDFLTVEGRFCFASVHGEYREYISCKVKGAVGFMVCEILPDGKYSAQKRFTTRFESFRDLFSRAMMWFNR